MNKYISCDFCHTSNLLNNCNYLLKNCKENRVCCNVCFKILTVKNSKVCPCCNVKNIEFLKIPNKYHDIVENYPFTI